MHFSLAFLPFEGVLLNCWSFLLHSLEEIGDLVSGWGVLGQLGDLFWAVGGLGLDD